ncbi:Fic family protein [Psychrobacillus soli]|uniref:Fic family protein n=1 Tax=Psychrobacillus soli TaxID=1543965 RepID=A0A544TGG4_9BACI|nr:Fic family protein [Psychrobacillus soli]TQR16531.1 Fic family protein [Psychrobacillus soli]
MKHLHKNYHEMDSKDFNSCYQNRISYESACKLDIQIKPMDQPNSYPLYYIPTNNIINKISEAYKASKKLEFIFMNLPDVAKNQFVMECLVEELYNTNELEGVKSSREEIARSAKEIKLNRKSKKRFNSMIKLYLNLYSGEIGIPQKPEDFRYIYDEITKGEIDESELPDGEIFRKEQTFVLKKSGTGKVIHHGIVPEEKLIKSVESLLTFLNEEQGVPDLIKVAIGHYYFGYIHPFYDGNGRTSRFISSVYLTHVLGKVSAFSLSRGSNKYRNKYLNAFEITNSLKGRGELNYFIDIFLDIIVKTLIEMTSELKEKVELLNLAYEKIDNESMLNDVSHSYKEILFVLAQNYFFDQAKGMTVKEISEEFNWSTATARKKIKELMEISLIEQFGERPAIYTVKEGYFDN